MHLLEFQYCKKIFPENRTDCKRYIPEVGEPNYLHISSVAELPIQEKVDSKLM